MDVSVYLRRNILTPWVCLERFPGNHLKCNLDRSRRRPQIAALKPEIRAYDRIASRLGNGCEKYIC
jgi:hypothetical protein